MLDLYGELSAAERIVPSVDKSDPREAGALIRISRDAGAKIAKIGLELLTAPEGGPVASSEIAYDARMDWIADQKLHDIPNTVAKTVRNYARLDHPPTAITILTGSGVDSMKAAQEAADEVGIVMLGVTELTSKTEAQLRKTFGFAAVRLGVGKLLDISLEKAGENEDIVRKALVHADALDAAEAGVRGLVASVNELLDPLGTDGRLAGMLSMIPGTRLPNTDTHDQKNVGTPAKAMEDGATLLVHGRGLFGTEDKPATPEQVVVNFRAIEENMQLGMAV